MTTTLGTQIRLRRLARGLSRAEVARRAELDFNHYCGIEKGTHKYTREHTLSKIMRVLDCHVVVAVVANEEKLT